VRTYSNALLLLLASILPGTSWALNIFACEPEWAALSREIAPDATIYSATTAHQDPHFVQAKPSLIAKMRRADLVICSGAELEVGWLPALLMKANNADVQSTEQGLLYIAEHVERLDQLEKVDRSMGDVHAMGNPHVHLSPEAISRAAAVLTERLIQLDSARLAEYRAAEVSFQQRWSKAVSRWTEQAAGLANRPLISYHSSYRYLFAWLGIRQIADLEPKPGLPPTSAHLAALLSQLQSTAVGGVVYTSYQDPKPASWLADKAGLPALQLAYSTEQQESLFSLYQRIIDTLLTLEDG